MRISVSAGYWSAGPPPGAADLFEAAERIGIDQIWTAEAYGSDAWTPLAWWGSRTERIKLGTAVSQLSARPPVTLAMTAMTMDHLTQGRVLLGIGTSNPQVGAGSCAQAAPAPPGWGREVTASRIPGRWSAPGSTSTSSGRSSRAANRSA